MKLRLFSIGACVLFACLLACTDKTKTTDETVSKDASPRGEFFPVGADSVLAEFDTVSVRFADNIKHYDIPVDTGQIHSFCGAVNKANDKTWYKFKLFFIKEGDGVAYKISMAKVTGGDIYSFVYKVRAKGKIRIVIEEERKLLGWKDLPLKELATVPPACCPPDKATSTMKLLSRTVGSSGGSGSGGSIGTEQK